MLCDELLSDLRFEDFGEHLFVQGEELGEFCDEVDNRDLEDGLEEAVVAVEVIKHEVVFYEEIVQESLLALVQDVSFVYEVAELDRLVQSYRPEYQSEVQAVERGEL